MDGAQSAVTGDAMREQGAWLWTKRQRAVLGGAVLIIAACLFVRAVWNPLRVSDPPPVMGELANDLATKIDPNTADWPAWAALPLIGEKRARQIVEYREAWQADHPGELPFEKLEDLTRVKGIGKGTIGTLEPYLVFPKRE